MQHYNRILVAATAAALFSLAACNNKPETIEGGVADPQAKELAKAKPVELPPAIAASRAYRCKDNSLVYIDFYTNNSAMVHKKKGDVAVATVTASEPGKPMTADGYSVSANASQITYTAPGKGTQSCKA